LLERIIVDPRIFGGKPIIRGRRLAVGQSSITARAKPAKSRETSLVVPA
jgi:uncharacterized protein (DUF433 family)